MQTYTPQTIANLFERLRLKGIAQEIEATYEQAGRIAKPPSNSLAACSRPK